MHETLSYKQNNHRNPFGILENQNKLACLILMILHNKRMHAVIPSSNYDDRGLIQPLKYVKLQC